MKKDLGMANLLSFPERAEPVGDEPEIRVSVGSPDEHTLLQLKMSTEQFEQYLDNFGTVLSRMFPWATIKLYSRLVDGADVHITHTAYDSHIEKIEIISLIREVKRGILGWRM
tara:strand:+ start:25311 stop:25649 length:339 start_codon:yes stop_codon:yes gene_type:complete